MKKLSYIAELFEDETESSVTFKVAVDDTETVSNVEILPETKLARLTLDGKKICDFDPNDEHLAEFCERNNSLEEDWKHFVHRLAEAANDPNSSYQSIVENLEDLPLGDPISCAIKGAVMSSVSEISHCVFSFGQHSPLSEVTPGQLISIIRDCARGRAKRILARFAWKTGRCILMLF